ncbi:hypothetical protein F8388_019586 [Cannabis sativa]|uniref:60S ribosomal protein L7a n=1 Tax=Cannabis sativa TaxID=3483 RepID=A0A7J6FF83_CANSA|nr:hypothetical protein F8388_019586 [Cannabis sativa]KAF4372664.1 hypothetical protein G4B88_024208 [Cannabis sativa]
MVDIHQIQIIVWWVAPCYCISILDCEQPIGHHDCGPAHHGPVLNPLFEKRPKQFGIGEALPPKRDLNRFVKWPTTVQLQRKKRILNALLMVFIFYPKICGTDPRASAPEANVEVEEAAPLESTSAGSQILNQFGGVDYAGYLVLDNIQLLRQRYYYATWKADGTRYMMLINVDGCYD